MKEPYLILHKVDGEPAFDVAIPLETPAGIPQIWIIPTSGHRAYPWRTWRIDVLVDSSDYPLKAPADYLELLPTDWPDHYQTAKRAPEHVAAREYNSLEELGL